MKQGLWLVFMMVLALPIYGQTGITDLRGDWRVFEAGQYRPLQAEEKIPHTIHFQISPGSSAADTLVISSFEPVSVWVNHQIVGRGKTIQLTMDSLAQMNAGKPVQLTVFQKEPGRNGLRTYLKSKAVPEDPALTLRPTQALQDFMVIAALVMITLFISILRLHPKLTSDYFAIGKIFQLRDKEDTQLVMRIGNSTNLLVYLLTALLLAYFLIVMIAKSPEVIPLSAGYRADTFLGLLLNWIILTSIILLFFLGKVLVVYSMSGIFQLRQEAGLQYFHWIRMLLVVVTAIGIFQLNYLYFSPGDLSIYSFLYNLLGWIMGLWILLLYSRFTMRGAHSSFHLFLYLCATEVIPFMILIHVFYF